MTFHHATREQAGIYEVVGEMFSDLDPGDWGVLRRGQVRMVFSRRRTGDGILPIIDWGPDFVRGGQLRKVRERVHEKVLDQHTARRRAAWVEASTQLWVGMEPRALREGLLRAIRRCPGVPTQGFVDLVSAPPTMGDMLGAWRSGVPLEIDETPANAVEEALRQLEREELVEGRYLHVPSWWGRNNTRRWYPAGARR